MRVRVRVKVGAKVRAKVRVRVRVRVRVVSRTEINQSVCIHGIADSPTVAHVDSVFLIFGG
jgi:hypothetical protein